MFKLIQNTDYHLSNLEEKLVTKTERIQQIRIIKYCQILQGMALIRIWSISNNSCEQQGRNENKQSVLKLPFKIIQQIEMQNDIHNKKQISSQEFLHNQSSSQPKLTPETKQKPHQTQQSVNIQNLEVNDANHTKPIEDKPEEKQTNIIQTHEESQHIQTAQNQQESSSQHRNTNLNQVQSTIQLTQSQKKNDQKQNNQNQQQKVIVNVSSHVEQPKQTSQSNLDIKSGNQDNSQLKELMQPQQQNKQQAKQIPKQEKQVAKQQQIETLHSKQKQSLQYQQDSTPQTNIIKQNNNQDSQNSNLQPKEIKQKDNIDVEKSQENGIQTEEKVSQRQKPSPTQPLSIVGFIQLLKHQNITITPQITKQIFDKFGNSQQITSQNAKKYLKSTRGFAHILNLKFEVWRSFNAFRNKLFQQGIIFGNDSASDPSNHNILLSLQNKQALQTIINLRFCFDKKFINNQPLLEIQFPTSQLQKQKLQSSIDQLRKNNGVIGQLFRCLNTSIQTQNNYTKLTITTSDHQIIADMVSDIRQYFKSFGEDFIINFQIELHANGKLQDALKNSFLKWLLEGFNLNFKISGSNGWLKTAKKYLSLLCKGGDAKLAAYISLVKNSNVNFKFKAPCDVTSFLNKLGITEIINKMKTIQTLMMTDSKQKSGIMFMMEPLKDIFLGLLSNSVALKLRLPLISAQFNIEGQNISQIFDMLI